RQQELERLARARGRRAEDELGLDAEGAEMLGDSLRVAPAARRERPLVIRESRIVPARLRVPEEVERPCHGSHLVINRACRRLRSDDRRKGEPWQASWRRRLRSTQRRSRD